MNIGIDIDDTITYTYENMLPFVSVMYNKNLVDLYKAKPSYQELIKTLPNYDKFVHDTFPAMVKLVPLRPHVVEVLEKLKRDGHKLIFITARSDDEYLGRAYEYSFEYLKVNKVPFDKLVIGSKNKSIDCISNNIDLFIDDSSKHCKAVQRKGIPVIQIANSFTSPVRGIRRAKDWNEVYDIIKEM